MGRATVLGLLVVIAAGACGDGATDAGSGASTSTNATEGTGPNTPTTSSSDASTGTDGNEGTGTGTGAGPGSDPTTGTTDTGTTATSAGETTGDATDSATSVPLDPACLNGQQDVDESDIDCGGSACPGCLEGQLCSGNLDCASTACLNGVCITPECTDKEQCTDVGCYLAACNALTFTCSFTPVGEGEGCDDGDACTLSSCVADVCTIDEVLCEGPSAPSVAAGRGR